MRIAIPVFNERLSPLFDTCRTLLLVDVDTGNSYDRRYESLENVTPCLRPIHLREIGVELLLCGGISRVLLERLELFGIRVVPWLGGDVNEVLVAWREHRLAEERFLLPGRNFSSVGNKQINLI